jgi:hypothetical protein
VPLESAEISERYSSGRGMVWHCNSHGEDWQRILFNIVRTQPRSPLNTFVMLLRKKDWRASQEERLADGREHQDLSQ